MSEARMAMRAGSQIPEGNPIRIIMDYHGITQRDAEFIADLIEQGGGDLWEISEKDLRKQSGDMINWVNKNGDWLY